MEERLRIGVEGDSGSVVGVFLRQNRRERDEPPFIYGAFEIFRSDNQPLEIRLEVAYGIHLSLFAFRLVDRSSLFRESLVKDPFDLVVDKLAVFENHNKIIWQKVQERDIFLLVGRHFRQDLHTFAHRFGELGLNVKDSDAVHLISEKVNSKRLFGGKGEYVDDTSPDGELPRLIDIVGPDKSVLIHPLLEVVEIMLLAHRHRKGVGIELTFGHHLLRKCLGIGYDKGIVGGIECVEHLCPCYFICRILLVVLDGSSKGRWKEKYLMLSDELDEVV